MPPSLWPDHENFLQATLYQKVQSLWARRFPSVVCTDEKLCPHGLLFCPWWTENSLRLAHFSVHHGRKITSMLCMCRWAHTEYWCWEVVVVSMLLPVSCWNLKASAKFGSVPAMQEWQSCTTLPLRVSIYLNYSLLYGLSDVSDAHRQHC